MHSRNNIAFMNRTISLAVSILATALIFAQGKIGFTAGVNFNKPVYSMSGDSLTNPGDIKSFGGHGGLYSYVNLAGKDMNYGLQSELLVSSRSHGTMSKDSSKVNDDINYYRESFAWQQMIYIDAPIHFRYNLILQKGRYGDANFLSFLVGPQFSFAVAKKYDVQHTFVTSLHDQETILREESNNATFTYKPLEIGLSAGIQLELKAGFRTGFRYYRALTNTADHESLKINNQMLMLYIGFNFASFGKKR